MIEEKAISRNFIQVVEWRVIEDEPDFEINHFGVVRHTRTKRVRRTNDRPRGDRLRLMHNGEKVSYPIRYLRNKAFPELDPI